jgi:hypothetical protein
MHAFEPADHVLPADAENSVIYDRGAELAGVRGLLDRVHIHPKQGGKLLWRVMIMVESLLQLAWLKIPFDCHSNLLDDRLANDAFRCRQHSSHDDFTPAAYAFERPVQPGAVVPTSPALTQFDIVGTIEIRAGGDRDVSRARQSAQ